MKRNRTYKRRAAAVVEMAVMAPLVVTAMFAMVEVGHAFMIKQTVTLAAREGARAGALPGGMLTDVESAVASAMGAASISGYSVDSNVSTLSPTDTEVWVRVSVPFEEITFTGHIFGVESFDIASQTTMRREGIDEQDGEYIDDERAQDDGEDIDDPPM